MGIKRKDKEENDQQKNVEDNMYSDFMSKEENVNNNESKKDNDNSISSFNSSTHGYKEKEYKTGSLEEHTIVTNASKVSRLFLFGFYALFIIVGIIAYLMIKSDKYAFYLKNEEATIFPGSNYQVELIPKNERYFDYLNYDYSIADKSIATVDEFGKVTAVGTGTTTLKVSLSPGFTSKTMIIHSESVNIETIDLRVYKDDKIQTADVFDMNPDQSISLKAVVNNRDDLNTNVTYSSSNSNVAIVDEFGNVTAKGEGTAVISGIRDNVLGTITIRVKKQSSGSSTPAPVKEIQSISFAASSNNITLKKGYKAQLSLVVTPRELSSSTFTWTSSNPSVAAVSDKGVVSGINNGTVTITATSSNGKKASCNVTITDQEVVVSSIKLNTNKTSIYVNGTYQLHTTLSPSTATVRDVIWSSNNPQVATVNQNGVVTGKSAGTAVITVATANGSVKATCTVTVNNMPTEAPTPRVTQNPGQQPKATKVTIDISQTEKYVGDKLQLSVSVEPKTITNPRVTWISNRNEVATVDQSTGLVTAKKAGTAVIIASVDGLQGMSTIIVRDRPVNSTPTPVVTPSPTQAPSTPSPVVQPPQGTQFAASQIKLSSTSLTVNSGTTAKFKVTATKAVGSIIVTSSDSSIATVDLPIVDPDIPACNPSKNICFLDGLTGSNEIEFTVTGKKAGTAYINISLSDMQSSSGSSLTGSGKVGILVK